MTEVALTTFPGAGRLTLVIEASTAAGSVAVFGGDRLAASANAAMGASRDDALFPAVQAALDAAQGREHLLGSVAGSVTEIVCGAGPGSFTSLRIAAAVAKGLAQASGARLYAVPSLLLAAAGHHHSGRFLVHSDALRGERYALRVVIDDRLMVRADGAMMRISADTLEQVADGVPLLAVSASSSAQAGPSIVPHAANLLHIGEWRAQGLVDLATWEPAYGRLAEAQVKWEAAHARALPTA
jgi:tRNA threonylcarbamoyladenosine biosynthesis protein TsaB